ncbi:MAG: glycosyltransferase family 2 protein [Myxococcota bacterium]
MTRYSLVIPVYLNEGSIPELLAAMTELNRGLDGRLEVIFVVDGSPDRSYALLAEGLAKAPFAARLLVLARNFGSFAAIRAGLAVARGPYFAVMAADLQEPPELVGSFFSTLENEPVDVVIGARNARSDPMLSRLASKTFWAIYRRMVQPDMPPGGFDIFGCNAAFRDQLLQMGERNSSLVGLVVWMGFRRKLVTYDRRERRHGRSAWTLRRKLKYMMDSIYAFSDLPIRLLVTFGAVGLCFAVGLGSLALIVRLLGLIPVPGYTMTLLVLLFFAALNSFGLGVIGAYVWRTFENTKARPHAIVLADRSFGGEH